MSAYRLLIIGLMSVLLLGGLAGSGWADRGGGRHSDSRPGFGSIRDEYVYDRRHNHNRYYPRHGYEVRHLPPRHRSVDYHGTRYYYGEGVWYRSSGVYFSVVAPPIGVVVPVLPRYYSTVWVGADPYYYADGAYYRWVPAQRGYLVVDPPDEAKVYDEPDVETELFVYPRGGQNEELQAKDRYECHRWAVDKTGFDPTLDGGGVSAASNMALRADYNRATKACLEARNYSVE